MPPGVVLASDIAMIEALGLSKLVSRRLATLISAGMDYFAFRQEREWASQQFTAFRELGFNNGY